MVVKKMKEKCKDAARMRREKERIEFLELSKLLPLPSSTTSQLDKASIIRLTSSYLRMRSAFPWGLGDNWGTKRRRSCHVSLQCSLTAQEATGADEFHQCHDATNESSSMVQIAPETAPNKFHQAQLRGMRELGSLILQTLDGFVFALHKDGKIMYISETASVQLGLSQIDLTGSSIFEYVHPADHNDMYKLLSLNDTEKARLEQETDDYCELSRSFCMRMKCILPKRNAGLVNSGYKAIHCNGYLKVRYQDSAGYEPKSGSYSTYAPTTASLETTSKRRNISNWEAYALVAVGHSLLPTATTEYKMSLNSFMFRANLDLKIYYAELQATCLLGFEQTDLIDQSLYQFVHLSDVGYLEQGHRSLLDKGQLVSKYIRLMRKGGGFVWVQTYAILVSNPRSVPKPQHIVGVCYVIGEDLQDESCLIYNEKQINTANHNYEEGAPLANTDAELLLDHKLNQITDTAHKKPQKKCKLNQSYDVPPIKGIDHTEDRHMASQLWNTKSSIMIETCESNQGGDKINEVKYMTIGCTRRASDDSGSVISSSASTSFSSTSPTIEKTQSSRQRIPSDDSSYRSEIDSSASVLPEIDPPLNCVEPFQSVWTRPTYETPVETPRTITYDSQINQPNSGLMELHTNQQPAWDVYGQETYSVCAQYKNRYVSDTAHDPKMDCYSRIHLVDMGNYPPTQNGEWTPGTDCHQTFQYDVICCETSPNFDTTTNYHPGNLNDNLRLEYHQDVNFSTRQQLTNASRAQ